MMNSKGKNRPHTQKVKTIALSIFLAMIVWLMVMLLTDPDITTTVSNLDVRFAGEAALREKSLAVTGKDSIPPLSVVVTGKRSDLMRNMDGIYVQVDLSDINSVGEYNLTGTISIPSTRIKVERERYGDIPITIEPLTTKEIDVTVKQTGSVKDKLVQSVISDPRVTIMGAESEMEKVEGAVATVDISNMREDNIMEVSYLLTDASGALINENETLESMNSNVIVTNTVYDIASLPVTPKLTEELSKNYILKTNETTVTPTAVTVGVKDSAQGSVTAVIDKPNGGEGEYRVEGGEGVYVPPESALVKVKPEIVRKETAQIELAVEAENVPEGTSAKVEGNVTATVTGAEGTLNADNVKASVDLEGLSKGTYLLPVNIYGDNISAEGEYTINVTIE